MELLGLSRKTARSILWGALCFLVLVVFLSFWSATPRTLVMTAGPEGSVFYTNAVRYAGLLAEHGVKLKVLPSRGSLENLDRLGARRGKVEVGFVLGGVTNEATARLYSLGSVSYQPIMIFFRGPPIDALTPLAGRRLSVGPIGSGTRKLAEALLAANNIKGGDTNGTTFLDLEPGEASKALLQGKVDAIFLMGEDAPIPLLLDLLRRPEIHLLSFKQAVAYTRRIPYLNVLELPEGSIDLSRDIPAHDVYLLGPTVELIARPDLHPALSDLLLEAAKKIHGRATVLQRKGEFPAPLEHDYTISPAAARFYKSGKTFFYRYLPFWLAAMVSQTLVVFVPVLIVFVPIIRSAPKIYTWRVRTRIYRWYRALLALEREWQPDLDPRRREQLLARLDEIERAVNQLRVPAFAADLYYDLRVHITFVRGLMRGPVLVRS